MRKRSPLNAPRAAGNKPAVAFRNHEAALANIESKVAVLAKLAKAWGRGAVLNVDDMKWRDAIVPLLPQSLRQFNAWQISENSELFRHGFPVTRTNAHQTLVAHPAVLAVVQDAISAVRALGESGPAAGSKLATIASLKRRAFLANTLRTIAERELVAAKRARHDLVLEVTALKARLAALERESLEAIGRLTADRHAAKATSRQRPPLKSV